MNKILVLISFIVFSSCERRVITNNSEEDMAIATKVATKFYKELSETDTLRIFTYLDESIPRKDLSKLIQKNIKDYGQINKVDIKKTSTTNVSINDKNEIKYTIETIVIYDKSKNLETLSLTKMDNDKVKITGYLTQEIIE